jgi:hypothetical protein
VSELEKALMLSDSWVPVRKSGVVENDRHAEVNDDVMDISPPELHFSWQP